MAPALPIQLVMSPIARLMTPSPSQGRPHGGSDLPIVESGNVGHIVVAPCRRSVSDLKKRARELLSYWNQLSRVWRHEQLTGALPPRKQPTPVAGEAPRVSIRGLAFEEGHSRPARGQLPTHLIPIVVAAHERGAAT
jgi:hypothetical protein